MITCPRCQHKELEGTLFCSECGAQLVDVSQDERSKTVVYPPQTKSEEPADLSTMIPDLSQPGEVEVSLHIIGTGEIISIAGRDEVSLGRVSEGQPIIPDVDLTPFQAYQAGVSRLHASLRIIGKMVTITDLGSANGTRVNGRKIPPNIPYPIQNGNTISLGNLKLQVLVEGKSWAKP